MHRALLFVLAVPVAIVFAAEPAPRPLTRLPLNVAAPFPHVTAAHELRGGALLISDAASPALWRLDPATGAVQPVGAAGPGADQYAQPGGFYAGANGAILLADHSGPKALVLSPDGRITGSYPTARRGVRSSSGGDTDSTRLDARGYAYFTDRTAGASQLDLPATVALIRLDPVRQTLDKVADLAIPKPERLPSGDGMILTRSTIGDPADGWGVLPDGRVAIVRARPYRVQWISASGAVTSGPVITYDPIPFTPEDRDAMIARLGTTSVGMSRGGSAPSGSAVARKFAANKPPFFPDDVLVAATGQVWVMRTQPFGATTVIYDVFDTTGARVDRVAFPVDSRVVGVGPSAVYVREGGASLRKYKLR